MAQDGRIKILARILIRPVDKLKPFTSATQKIDMHEIKALMSLFVDAYHVEDKGVLESRVFNSVIATCGTAVA